ncbi:hypothetical protein L916_14783 [Phytophthora nicotianae]|uniref:Uncharacterized protein n=2 Tax=Phytophthora nicotianae TaxID=4792 RepID=W2IET4_PHYNI|nr:hypothetical protein L916_14783 [Phytophthora nicotianae]
MEKKFAQRMLPKWLGSGVFREKLDEKQPPVLRIRMILIVGFYDAGHSTSVVLQSPTWGNELNS